VAVSYRQLTQFSFSYSLYSSCHFFFNHPGLPTLQNSTQFSNSNSLLPLKSQNQSHIATDGRSVSQSVSQSWCRAYCLTVMVLLLWGSVSDERTGLSFVRYKPPSYRLSLYSLGSDSMENPVFSCPVLCYLATSFSTVQREHSSYCCVFAGTRILSRCLAVGRYVTICTCSVDKINKCSPLRLPYSKSHPSTKHSFKNC
jgi:hypothetical protein